MKLHQFIKPILLIVFSVVGSLAFAQYTGGDASGTVCATSIQSVCTPITYPDMFKGGNEDGFQSLAVVQANCSPPVVPSIFTGGSDDGHSMAQTLQVSCSPVVYPNIFTGGSDDGFSTFVITQANCTPHVYPSMFTGGNDDGFAAFNLTQINCNPGPLPDIYSGGNDDGHSMVAMFTACAPFADFIADQTVVCQGDTVHFTDLSLGTPVSWSWTFNGGNPVNSALQNPSVVYDTPGVYSVTLFITSGTGNSSMTKIDYIVVNAAPQPVISASGPTTFCDGDSVLLTCSPAYPSYLWSDGSVVQNIWATNAGTYSVTATAPNGCQGVSNFISIDLLSNPVPTIFTSAPSPVCTGDTVVLTSSPANSYQWAPGGQTTQNITVLSSGTFWVSASYSNGCSRLSDPVIVNFGNTPAKPVITPSGPLTFCNGESVTLNSSPAPSYLWSPGGQTSQSVLITTSGTFYVEAIGTSGCSSLSDPVTVTVLPQTPVPVITAGGPVTFCSGDSVVLTSSSASTYLWTPGGQTTQSVTITSSGTYTVQTDNGTGCTAESLPVTVTVNTTPATPIITPSGPITFCQGDSVVLTSSPAGSYFWQPSGSVTQSVTVTTDGTYWVEVSNGSCTAVSDPVTVQIFPVPPVPAIVVNGSPEICEGDSVLLTSSPADSYIWYPGGETSQGIWVSSSGTFWVETFNSSGCSTVSTVQNITVHPNPDVSVSGDLIVCAGTTEDYSVDNTPSTDYYWTVSGATLTGGSGTSSVVIFFNDIGSVYIGITVVNQVTACTSTDSLLVSSLPAPQAYAGSDIELCFGDTVQLHAYGGTTYTWIPESGLSDSGVSDPIASPSVTTEYIVEVANGSCTDRDSILVTVNPLPVADAGPDGFISQGECITLTGSGGSYFYWSPGTGLSSQTSSSPEACPDSTTEYVLVVTDLNGCSAEDDVTVYVTAYSGDIVFPNTFSPNGDGTNDVWIIDDLEAYPYNKLIVFNRWGNKVFDAQPYLNDWGGECIGKPLPDGTYYFVLDPGDGGEVIKSFVTIMR